MPHLWTLRVRRMSPIEAIPARPDVDEAHVVR